jgi:hypothetical protein
MNSADTKLLRSIIAGLESRIDLLESELIDLNSMLLACGFPEGIKSLKETMVELISEDASSPNQECS